MKQDKNSTNFSCKQLECVCEAAASEIQTDRDLFFL